MNVNDIIYGNNNEEYFIEEIDEDYIIVKYTREIFIAFNNNNNKKKETKIETLTFYFNQIGINIFFKKNDCKKNANELLEDVEEVCELEVIPRAANVFSPTIPSTERLLAF